MGNLRGCAVTASSIVIDGYQFLRPSGTGIASYVRTLSLMLKASGCSVSLLYGRRYRPNRRLSRGAAAAIFTQEVPDHSRLRSLRDNAELALGLLTGAAFRANAVAVDTIGLDLRALDPPLPVSDQILNSDRLYSRAHRAFQSSGRFTQLHHSLGDRKFAAAHWTAPVPVRMRGVPNIYTLHDLVPLQYPHFVIGYGDRTFQMHEIIARIADHIVTVSEASKRQIVELLKVPEDRVSVTYQPVPALPSIDPADAERLVEMFYGVKPGQYALFVGAIEPKKNLKRLIECYLTAGINCPLLLAGPLGWLYDEELELIDLVNKTQQATNLNSAKSTLQALAALNGADSHVRQLGYLPRRHMVALLRCAKFFVFPSICEGFGLPVLEAMQLGVPVLTSNTSSLPEVAGDAAVLVDPMNAADITSGLRRIDADEDLRGELSQRGPAQAARFSSDHCRGLLVRAYEQAGVSLKPASEATPHRKIGSRNPQFSPARTC